jgi:hypothetical protein
MIVSPATSAPVCQPAIRDWRHALSPCFTGTILRSATRVVVHNQDDFNRALVKDVEPSRIDFIDPTADLIAFYTELYEEMRVGRTSQGSPGRHLAYNGKGVRPSREWLGQHPVPVRPPAHSKHRRLRHASGPHHRQVSMSHGVVRLKRGGLFLSLVTIALVAAALLTPIATLLGRQLTLSLVRQPERYTAVFFPKPLALPTNVKVGSRMAFTFAVANHGANIVTYRYTVTESASGAAVGVMDGEVRVASGGTIGVPLIVRVAQPGPKLTVRVTVRPSDLDVAFYVHEVRAR